VEREQNGCKELETGLVHFCLQRVGSWPPTPCPLPQSAANVQIVADAQRVMYVTSYPGFSSESDVVQQATNLMAVCRGIVMCMGRATG
jgi:hypothetical protein